MIDTQKAVEGENQRTVRLLADLPLDRDRLPGDIAWPALAAHFAIRPRLRAVLLETKDDVPAAVARDDCLIGAMGAAAPLAFARVTDHAVLELNGGMPLAQAARTVLNQHMARLRRPILVRGAPGGDGLLDPVLLLVAVSESTLFAERSHRDLLMEVQRYACELEDAIEQRHRMEGQLVEARKMEALSTLAGGLAHEINTPAQVIKSNLDFLYEAALSLQLCIQGLNEAITEQGSEALKLQAGRVALDTDVAFYLEEVQPGLKQASRSIQDIQRIVGSIQALAVRETTPATAVDLRVLLQSAATLAKARWNPRARVECAPWEDRLVVSGHETDLNQAILAVLANAMQATEGREDARIDIRAERRQRDILVEVADNGPGIRAEIRCRIFDPFFTTKAPGAGTGMGLTLCAQILARYGGQIECRDAVSGGACFRIILPISQDGASAA